MDALILLWLAMLLATDLVDDDPTLFAACNFENDPIGFTGSIGAISAAGVFSPNSQYVVTFPLPYTRQKKEMEIKIFITVVSMCKCEVCN